MCLNWRNPSAKSPWDAVHRALAELFDIVFQQLTIIMLTVNKLGSDVEANPETTQ